MKKKKILSLALAFVMLVAATTGAVMVLADTYENGEDAYDYENAYEYDDEDLDEEDQADEQDEDTADSLPYYISVTGTVISVEDNQIKVENTEADYEDAVFFINTTDSTVFPFAALEDIAEGDVVTAFLPANAPVPMIYPPQYPAHVVVAGVPEGQNVQVDRFGAWDNEDFPLLAYGGQFAFAIAEDTEVITADGDEFDGDLDGRRLVVIYSTSTRSIPELATATEVIVLFEDAVPLDNGEDVAIDATGWPIVVNGTEIDAPAAFMADDGVNIMVPLRAIAEALGFEVTWVPEGRVVELSGMSGVAEVWARIAIGSTEAAQTYARRAEIAIELPVAPVLVEGRTFVPLTAFFQDVLEMANAFAFEGVIEVQAEGETMN